MESQLRLHKAWNLLGEAHSEKVWMSLRPVVLPADCHLQGVKVVHARRWVCASSGADIETGLVILSANPSSWLTSFVHENAHIHPIAALSLEEGKLLAGEEI